MSEKTLGLWRLPTIKELETLLYETDTETKNGLHWSEERDSNTAWVVGSVFILGTLYDYKNYTNYVRCVRDTETELEWSEIVPRRMSWNAAVKYAENLNKKTIEQEKHTMKLEDLKPGDEFQDSDITTDATFLNKSPCPINIEIIGDHKYSLCNQWDTLVVAKDAGNGHGVVINTVTY